ncbi:MAG: hypothetical protein MJE68_14140 [Proteobacteria bacterium]|nr:hypothetical protein [Pseudomonadota bacterium]
MATLTEIEMRPLLGQSHHHGWSMGWHDTSSRLSSCETVTSSRMVYGLARHIVTAVFV